MKGEGFGWLLAGAVLWFFLWAEDPGCLQQIGFIALFLGAWVATWKGLVRLFPAIDDPLASILREEEKRRANEKSLKQPAADSQPDSLPPSESR